MKRKPPQKVRSITGPHKPDVITQAELNRAAELQAAEWLAAQAAHKANSSLHVRLLHGASVEIGEFTFDRELRMVRRRKAVGE